VRHRILARAGAQANKADTIFHFSPLAMQEQANQTDPDAPQLVGEWRRAWSRVMRMASEFHRPGGAAPLFRDACARTYDRRESDRVGGEEVVAKAPAPGRSTAHVSLFASH